MMKLTSYKDLQVWQKSMELAQLCYSATAAFPKSELFGLTSQIRAASVSIPSNIAEGHRRSTRGFLLHLEIALGSQAEVETQIELSRRVGLMSDANADRLLSVGATIGRLLHGLVRSVESSAALRMSERGVARRGQNQSRIPKP